jgi:acyl-CoA thioester hydrolase
MPSVVTVELEVRWGECDPAGIVYHPVYFDWFSVARMRFLRENGISYMESFHDNGIVLVVLDVGCQYKKTLRAEDKVFIETRMAVLSRTRIRMRYQVWNEHHELCGEGFTEHAYVDEQGKAVNIAKRTPDLWNRLQTVSRE